MVAISKYWQNSPRHNLQMNFVTDVQSCIVQATSYACFTPRNNPSVIGMMRISCVHFGINQCTINCLTLVNSTLVIWMLRFAKRMHQVWLCMQGYLDRSMPICNTFCIVTRIAPQPKYPWFTIHVHKVSIKRFLKNMTVICTPIP